MNSISCRHDRRARALICTLSPNLIHCGAPAFHARYAFSSIQAYPPGGDTDYGEIDILLSVAYGPSRAERQIRMPLSDREGDASPNGINFRTQSLTRSVSIGSAENGSGFAFLLSPKRSAKAHLDFRLVGPGLLPRRRASARRLEAQTKTRFRSNARLCAVIFIDTTPAPTCK